MNIGRNIVELLKHAVLPSRVQIVVILDARDLSSSSANARERLSCTGCTRDNRKVDRANLRKPCSGVGSLLTPACSELTSDVRKAP